MLVKVCGLKSPEQIQTIETIADCIGFIYYQKSKRFVNYPPKSNQAKRVGVFVNETLEFVKAVINRDELDIVQLHGNESPTMAKKLRKHATVIKAFGMDDEFNFRQLFDYEGKVDYFLFDTKTPLHGGSGKQFRWEILNRYNLTTPFFLSGGIKPESLEEIKALEHPSLVGIDINSGFEIEPGNKDINAVKTFIHALRNN
ncbi:MAG: phosphoribosylanthranilate isomerase [Crocinitomicaceae bacterium]|nr:phosphoribosylanthranilate isomerase [Crocinitomicaceae bacterium]